MKKLFVVIIAIAFTCVCAYAGVGDPNFTKVYQNGKGDVTFNHQGHADSLQDCASCHSMFQAFGGVVNKQFGHNGCKACHQKMEVKSAVICSGCHAR